MPSNFYDGGKLLSMKDIDGDRPTIYMSTSNRCAGKTTYFTGLLINKFIKTQERFIVLYRWKKELNEVSSKIFENVAFRFPDYSMSEKKREKGSFSELFLKHGNSKDTCGYAVALNGSDDLRKASGELSSVQRMFFDEFQSESNKYCPNEVEKFLSIYTTVARGGGQQARYLPVYMCSNPVTLLNPYFAAMDVASRLRKDTKFLRGPGWVLEQNVNESAQNAMRKSGIAKAMGGSRYMEYAASGTYLLDDNTFIAVPDCPTYYIATLLYDGTACALRRGDDDVFYFGGKPDNSCPVRIAVTNDDHSLDTTSLRANKDLMRVLRRSWDLARLRFADLKSRDAALRAISHV